MYDEGLIWLWGENGSGKTTFLKTLCGIIPVGSGTITVNGNDITLSDIQRRRVVYINQNTYFPHLDVEGHIKWAAKLRASRIPLQEVMDAFGIDYSGRVGRLSLGQKMRVAMATAFFGTPDVILLDEVIPSVSGQGEIFEHLSRLSARYSIDVIFVSQNITDSHSGPIYIMKSGTMEKVR